MGRSVEECDVQDLGQARAGLVPKFGRSSLRLEKLVPPNLPD